MHQNVHNKQKNIASASLAVLTSIFLAIVLIGSGYVVCAYVPQLTKTLSAITSNDEKSPFTKEQLSDVALEIRNYSFGSHEKDDLYKCIIDINAKSDTIYAGLNEEEISLAPTRYSLDANQISHLDDVYSLSTFANYVLFVSAVVALLAFFLVYKLSPKWAHRALICSSIFTLAVMVIVAISATSLFTWLFEMFHSILFSGNWTFPDNSLLICALPEKFWQYMAFIWGGVTILLSIVCLVAGLFMRRGNKLKQHAQ